MQLTRGDLTGVWFIVIFFNRQSNFNTNKRNSQAKMFFLLTFVSINKSNGGDLFVLLQIRESLQQTQYISICRGRRNGISSV